MATFIPERSPAVDAQGIRLRRALGALDDAFVVRTPLPRGDWTPDLVVHHPRLGWLMVCVCDARADEVVAERLVPTPARTALDAQLDRLMAAPASGVRLGRMIVMWRCSPEEVRTLAAGYADRLGVTFIARDSVLDFAASVIPDQLVPVDAAVETEIMRRYFPETEIPPSWTTRRAFARDNSASLGPFFLDVRQEAAVRLDLEPTEEGMRVSSDLAIRLVNGVAGSGKTLIALARARLLARHFPDQRVRVLIYNTPIVADIIARVRQTDGGLRRNLLISTFHQWAHAQWRNLHDRRLVIAGPRLVERVIERHRPLVPRITLPTELLREELDFLNDSLITDLDAYVAASRTGRGFALRGDARADVWRLLQKVNQDLDRREHVAWSALARDICLASDHGALERFDHAVIDEAQFFAPSWFQAVRLALRPTGSLFVCADPNQGFMKRRLSWRSVGLEVTGRTRRLRRSYRTTRAILTAANHVLARCGPEDPEDFLVPDMSDMEPGTPPILAMVAAPQDAVDRLLNELDALVGGGGDVSLADVLVVYGDGVPRDLLHARLRARFGDPRVWWFNHPDQKRTPPAGDGADRLRLANLATATGLEAPVVFLLGVERLLGAIEDGTSQDVEDDARRLYMAMTRAGRMLVVMTTRPLPGFLTGVFTHPQPRRDAGDPSGTG